MSDAFDDALKDAQVTIDVTPVAGAPEDEGPLDGLPTMASPIYVERADFRPVHLSRLRKARARALAGVITGSVLIAVNAIIITYGLMRS